LGRVAGAAARTGALGDKLAEAADLARVPRELAPGLYGDVRHYSPNVIKKAAQVAVEGVPLPDSLVRRLAEHRLNRRTDDSVGITQAIHRKRIGQLMQDQADVLRGGTHLRTAAQRKAAADVASFVVQGVVSGGEHMADELRIVRDRIQHHIDHGSGDRAAMQAARDHVRNLDRFLANPDEAAVREIAAAYVKRQREDIDPELVRLGLLDPSQARMAPLEPYVAAGHMPGVRIAARPGEVSVRSAMLRDARRTVKYLDNALQKTKLDTLRGGRGVLDAELRDAKTKLTNARVAEQRTYGILLGRHGRDATLPPKVAKRMNRYLDATHTAQLHLDRVRVALRSDQADRRALAVGHLSAAREALKNAKSDARKLDKYENERLAGVVMDTPFPIAGGRYAVRRVTADEIEQHMRAAGKSPEDIGYVNLSAPTEPNGRPYLSRALSRGDTPSRMRTASGVMRGAFKPGHTVMADSQARSLNLIDRAKGFDEFARQMAVHHADGSIADYDKYEVEQALHAYEVEHRIPVTAVPLRSAAKNAQQAAKIRELQSYIAEGDP
ncbi:MAG: hypothetical protein ACRDNS_30615, partial [Trebonia sp.]